MNAWAWGTIASLCVVASAGVWSSLLFTMMIGEINRKRPDGNLVSYFGFTFFKMTRVLREYRRLYPTGRLSGYMRACLALWAISGVGMVVCFFHL